MCVYCDLTRVVCVDEKKIDGIRRIVLIILIRITKLKSFNFRPTMNQHCSLFTIKKYTYFKNVRLKTMNTFSNYNFFIPIKIRLEELR